MTAKSETTQSPEPFYSIGRTALGNISQFAETAASYHPSANPEQLAGCLGVLDDLFDMNADKIAPDEIIIPAVDHGGEAVIHRKDKSFADILIIQRVMLGYLRYHYDTVFDMPNARILEKIKNHFVVQYSRREVFNRLVCRPYGCKPETPFIVGRWNSNSDGPIFIQLGVAYENNGVPTYAVRTVITERNEMRLPGKPTEEAFPVGQDYEYWKLIKYAARTSLAEKRFPFACIVVPAGEFSPLIIGRNKNSEQGEGLDGHAEHIALTDMNHKGYKVACGMNDKYGPDILSFLQLCHGCSLAAREQGILKVRHALLQPPGWAGTRILLDHDLTPDCGEPPSIVHVAEFQQEALQIIRETNELFPGKFKDIIRANS